MTIFEKGLLKMGNYFAYERISTREERNIQKFNRQNSAIEKYSKENNISFVIIFKDDCSGSSFNRAEWNRLEAIVKSGDTIVFKDITRFTRQTEQGFKKYIELLNKGIELIFLDNPTCNTAYIKKMMNIASEQNIIIKTSLESIIKLILLIEFDRAEQERIIFVERIKAGIKASPKKSGRKQGQVLYLTDELKRDIKEYLQNRKIKQVDLMRKYKISRNTLKKYISIIEPS